MRLLQQLSAFVLSAFRVLALALAAVGLHGVVSYGVARRTREIGIRKALNADGPRVVRLLVAGGLKLVVVGNALGLPLAVVATRLLGGLPFEIEALNPLKFPGVPFASRRRSLPAGPRRQTGPSGHRPPDRLSAGRATTDSEPCSKQRCFDGLGRAGSAQVWRMNRPLSRLSLASHAQAKRLKPIPKTTSAPNFAIAFESTYF